MDAGPDDHPGRRRLPELFRQAGLEDIEVVSYAPVYPAGHSRRTLLPDLVRSMRPMILKLGLADERELTELDRAVRAHFADPRTLTMPQCCSWSGAASRPPEPPGCVKRSSRHDQHV